MLCSTLETYPRKQQQNAAAAAAAAVVKHKYLSAYTCVCVVAHVYVCTRASVFTCQTVTRSHSEVPACLSGACVAR